MKHEFKSDKILLTYDDEVCVHAGACVRALPSVFDPSRDPWISIEGADPDALEGAVDQCPSGALYCEVYD